MLFKWIYCRTNYERNLMSNIIKLDNEIIQHNRKIQTDIFNGGTSEFFINMKKEDIPPIGSADREAFVKWEREKCKKGVYINGVYITGRLYYHLNYHKIQLDHESGERVISNPLLRDNEWIIFNEYEKAIKEKKGFLIGGSRQISKDLLNSSLLYKKDKEITIGEVKVGEEIYGDDGKLTKVIGVYPQGIQPVYKITLADKREIFAGKNHNWWVYDVGKHKYSKRTTLELLKDYKMYRKSWKKRKNPYTWRYSIDLCKPVEYEEKELFIPPYLMGVWLGDGDSRRFAITTMDSEVEDEIYSFAEKSYLTVKKYDNKKRKSKASHYSFTFGKNYKRRHNEVCITNQILKDLNLIKNKHIPSIYLYSSIEQRLELLKGILDSDGTSIKGTVSFSNTNIGLIKDVEKLVRSLGMSCSLSSQKTFYTYKGEKKEGKLAYHLQIFSKIPLFKIKRKIEKQGISKYSKRVPITNIEYVFNENTTCIEVDNESHLFLTDGYTITHNTEFQCSTSLYMINLYNNTEALLLFTNAKDKETYVKKAQTAIMAGEKWIVRTPIDNSWKNTEIRFGFTKKDNTTQIFARLFLYNTDGDNASEAGAGKTVNYFSYDEIGKESMRNSYEAVIPALISPYGLRCSPILAFTGGNLEKSKDAEEMFFNPESARLKTYNNEGKTTGFFMGGWYRQDFKNKITLGEYLNNKGNNINKKSELFKIDFYQTDFDKANKVLDEEEAIAKKSKDPTAFIKVKTYFPRSIKDMFIKQIDNKFNKDYIEQQLQYLEEISYDKVDLLRDIKTGQVKHKFSSSPVITDWRKPYYLDAPVKVWDFPKYTEYGVHVIGLDGYREDQTSTSDSLGYFTVLRRFHSDITDPFRGKQVASYLGRKRTVNDFLQLVLDAAEWYNAQILYEHVDRSVLDFFEKKRKLHLLIDSVPLQREIAIKTKTKNTKGLRATVANQQFLLNSTLGWVHEEMEDDSLGYSRLYDTILLQQLLEYDPDENLDCYIGFSHAVVAYNYFEKFGVFQIEVSNKEKLTSNKKPLVYNAFGIPYNKNKKNAFGF